MKFSIHFTCGLGLIATLAGCGGGGGGTSPTTEPATTPLSSTTVSGVALNSYLENATVFLDVNGDGVLNKGEPSATTNANGIFTFATTESLTGRFLVLKATTATKMDGVLLNQGMTFMAPAEKPSVVSPLTTDVVAKMKNNPNWSVDEAKSAVQSDLGLDASLDVMKDYIKEKSNNGAYAKVQNVSTVVSALLKTVEAQSTSSTPVATRLAALNTEINTKLLPIINDVKNAGDVAAAKARLDARIQELANSSGGFQKPNSAPSCVTSADAIWLTDYVGNMASAGCLTAIYDAGILKIANKNVVPVNIATAQGLRQGTTTNGPIASIILESLPNLETPLKGEIKIFLTKALSTSSVAVTLQVQITKVNNSIKVHALDGKFKVNVLLASASEYEVPFSTADVIAETTSDQGNVILNFNVLGLITKLKSNTDLNAILSAYENFIAKTTYPTAGDYTISIQNAAPLSGDWPFKTTDKKVLNGISIELPIK